MGAFISAQCTALYTRMLGALYDVDFYLFIYYSDDLLHLSIHFIIFNEGASYGCVAFPVFYVTNPLNPLAV